jgi:hypothetical protein
MLKRVFWLVVAGVAGWLIWMWYQQRQSDLSSGAPHFAPPAPIDRPSAFPPAPARPLQPVAPRQTDQPAAAELETAERVPGAAEGAAAPETAGEAAVASAGAADDLAADTADEQAPASELAAETTAETAVGGTVAAAMTTANENERATAEASAAVVPGGKPIDEEVSGYCVRCKTKRAIQNAHEETPESGRRAARGTCPVCGANMFTFLKDDEEAEISN